MTIGSSQLNTEWRRGFQRHAAGSMNSVGRGRRGAALSRRSDASIIVPPMVQARYRPQHIEPSLGLDARRLGRKAPGAVEPGEQHAGKAFPPSCRWGFSVSAVRVGISSERHGGLGNDQGVGNSDARRENTASVHGPRVISESANGVEDIERNPWPRSFATVDRRVRRGVSAAAAIAPGRLRRPQEQARAWPGPPPWSWQGPVRCGGPHLGRAPHAAAARPHALEMATIWGTTTSLGNFTKPHHPGGCRRGAPR